MRESLRSLRYGDEQIAFSVRVQPSRKARRIAIHVEPDGRVVVDVPQETSEAALRAALQRRARWISGELAALRARLAHALPSAGVSGSSLLYLGQHYLLKVVIEEGCDARVRLCGSRIEVAVAQGDAARVQAALAAWYGARAAEVIGERLAAIVPALPWVRAMPPLRLRETKRRWGSCSPSGGITLNPNLVKASRECIDYVLIHELCHLQARGHGPDFQRLMDAHLPPWRAIKMRLDEWVDQLMPA